MRILRFFLLIAFFYFNMNCIYSNEIVIDFSAKYNYRQTYNDCGPYSIACVLTILKNKPADITYIKEKLKSRLKDNSSLPWGVENFLKDNNIKIKTISIPGKPDNEKIQILKKSLAEKKPVIVLVTLKGKYPHYMTLLGYDDTSFFIYDSVLKANPENKKFTVDLNAYLPGNRNIAYKNFLTIWNDGGMYGFYRNYAIICSN